MMDRPAKSCYADSMTRGRRPLGAGAQLVWRGVASCVVLMAGYAVGAAHAATPARTIAFSIPPGTLSDDLVKFAIQSNISVGLDAVDACADHAGGLKGRYTIEDGLQRILNGTGCGYRALDARAYVIQPLPRTFASTMVPPGDSPPSVELSELVVTAPRLTTPGDLSNGGATDGLATTVSNVLGDGLGSQSGASEPAQPLQAPLPILGVAPVAGQHPTPVLEPPPVSALGAAVPEPGAWATMLLGLGALGASLRRRRDHLVNKRPAVSAAPNAASDWRSASDGLSCSTVPHRQLQRPSSAAREIRGQERYTTSPTRDPSPAAAEAIGRDRGQGTRVADRSRPFWCRTSPVT